MGAPAVRLGDICSGHGCWPPRPNIQASSNVFVNGRGWHRQGDNWAVHCCNGKLCHGGQAKPKSEEPTDEILDITKDKGCDEEPEEIEFPFKKMGRSVFVNGRIATRIGDPVTCGSSMVTGSENVFTG